MAHRDRAKPNIATAVPHDIHQSMHMRCNRRAYKLATCEHFRDNGFAENNDSGTYHFIHECYIP